ncbi:unnamed protein product, partial [Prorocentrum cordatum]
VAPCALPQLDLCIYNTTDCNETLPPGAQCSVLCRAPFAGAPGAVSCPADNTSPGGPAPLAGLPLCAAVAEDCPAPASADGYTWNASDGWTCAEGFIGLAEHSCTLEGESNGSCLLESHLSGCVPLQPCLVVETADLNHCQYNASGCAGGGGLLAPGSSCELSCAPPYVGSPTVVSCPAENLQVDLPLLPAMPNCTLRCAEGPPPPGFRRAGSGLEDAGETNGTNGTGGADGTNATHWTNDTVGADGADEANMTNGTGGADGANGTNSTNGSGGADGVNGTNSTNGSGGADGANGTNATNGTGGVDGSNETNRTNSTRAMENNDTWAAEEVEDRNETSGANDTDERNEANTADDVDETEWECADGFAGTAVVTCNISEDYCLPEFPELLFDGCQPVLPCGPPAPEGGCGLVASDCDGGVPAGGSCKVWCAEGYVSNTSQDGMALASCPADNVDPERLARHEPLGCTLRYCPNLTRVPAEFVRAPDGGWACAEGFFGNVTAECVAGAECSATLVLGGCSPVLPCAAAAVDECLVDASNCSSVPSGGSCELRCAAPQVAGNSTAVWNSTMVTNSTVATCPLGNDDPDQPLNFSMPECTFSCAAGEEVSVPLEGYVLVIEPILDCGGDADQVFGNGTGNKTANATDNENETGNEAASNETDSGSYPSNETGNETGNETDSGSYPSNETGNETGNETQEVGNVTASESNGSWGNQTGEEDSNATGNETMHETIDEIDNETVSDTGNVTGNTTGNVSNSSNSTSNFSEGGEVDTGPQCSVVGNVSTWKCAERFGGSVREECVMGEDCSPHLTLAGCEPLPTCSPPAIDRKFCFVDATDCTGLLPGESCELRCRYPYVGRTKPAVCSLKLGGSNVSRRNGSNASELTGWNVSELGGSNASDSNGSNVSELNGSNAWDANGSNVSELNGSNTSELNGSVVPQGNDVSVLLDSGVADDAEEMLMMEWDGLPECNLSCPDLPPADAPRGYNWTAETGWRCDVGFIGDPTTDCYEDDHCTIVVTISGCIELMPCLPPNITDECMFNASECVSLQPGEQCSILCKHPYDGAPSVTTCPGSNTDATYRPAYIFPQCSLVCPTPDPLTLGYNRSQAGNWSCAIGYEEDSSDEDHSVLTSANVTYVSSLPAFRAECVIDADCVAEWELQGCYPGLPCTAPDPRVIDDCVYDLSSCGGIEPGESCLIGCKEPYEGEPHQWSCLKDQRSSTRPGFSMAHFLSAFCAARPPTRCLQVTLEPGCAPAGTTATTTSAASTASTAPTAPTAPTPSAPVLRATGR